MDEKYDSKRQYRFDLYVWFLKFLDGPGKRLQR